MITNPHPSWFCIGPTGVVFIPDDNLKQNCLIKTGGESEFSLFTLYLIDFRSASPPRSNSRKECKNNWRQTKAIFGGKIEAGPASSSKLSPAPLVFQRKERKSLLEPTFAVDVRDHLNIYRKAEYQYYNWKLIEVWYYLISMEAMAGVNLVEPGVKYDVLSLLTLLMDTYYPLISEYRNVTFRLEMWMGY